MPTLTIDDKQITVPNGTLIVEAARQLGIEVPVFCYHSRLQPVGMCRMCLVEVGAPRMGPDRKPILKPDGTPEIGFMPAPQAGCITTVSEGMVVKVHTSQMAIEARKGVVEFLLTNHPLDCPICDKGGECPLQEQTLTHGSGVSRFPYNNKGINEKNVPLGDLIVLDRERCVICARCIRFQDEIAGDSVLGFNDRGRGIEIITFSNPGFDSKFSGNTADVCPVGALTTRDFRFGARPWEMQYTPTVCPHCAVGCNMTLSVRDGDDIKRVLPRTNTSVNDLWICDKGRFAHHFVQSAKRITSPMIRKNGELVVASWDEAIKLVTQKFAEAKIKNPQSIAGVMGDRVSNEDMYLFTKFFKEVLGSENLRSVGAPDDLNMQVGLATGSDVAKLGKGNAIFVIGSDVEEEAPVAFLRLKQGKESGAALIVANGRKTKLDRYATMLRCHYGAEGQLLAGLLHVIVNESLANMDFVSTRTTGFDALRDSAQVYDPNTVAARTGISADVIRTTARTLASSKDVVLVYGRELPQDAKPLLQTLALVTGHVGRANNGVLPILAHNNSQGVRAIMPPHTYAEAKVLYVMGVDVLRQAQDGILTAPFAVSKDARENGTEFMIVQDILMTPTAQQADVVLPAQTFAEREGTFMNYERRVQYYAKALRPVGESKPDWQIITELAVAMKAKWPYEGADEVFAEMATKVAGFNGMSYSKLKGLLMRSRSHFLYEGSSYETRDGQGMVIPSTAENAETKFELKFTTPTLPSNDLQLVAPRTLYNAGTLISETELLHPLIPTSYADLNRADAKRLSIKDGDLIRLKTTHGAVDVTARVDGRAPEGVVIAPMNLKPTETRTLLPRGAVTTPATVEKR
jgi:NADH-quinone oxidoreductase subunit G